MRVELEQAYILHTRPFGDTSVIATCFSEHHGRIPLIAKGVRNKKVKQRQYLQLFTPLTLSWQGKSNLKTLTHMETRGLPRQLSDKRLYSGFYLNEIMVRLLPEHDDHPQLFNAYADAIEALYGDDELEAILRQFEFCLLSELGYGLNFRHDAGGQPISGEVSYRYIMEQGFTPGVAVPADQCFAGEVLLAMAREDFAAPGVRQAAKRLSRQVMAPLLGNRPLQSRNLFQSMVPQGAGS